MRKATHKAEPQSTADDAELLIEDAAVIARVSANRLYQDTRGENPKLKTIRRRGELMKVTLGELKRYLVERRRPGRPKHEDAHPSSNG